MQAVGHAKIVLCRATLALKRQVVVFNLMSSEERDEKQQDFYCSEKLDKSTYRKV